MIASRTLAGVENSDVDSQPTPTPLASVTTPSTTITIAAHAATNRIRAERSGSARAHATVMNTAPTSAGTLIVAASAQIATPASGLPRRASDTPAASSPIISASLWPAAISDSITSGHAIANHTAAPRSVPSERAMRGT